MEKYNRWSFTSIYLFKNLVIRATIQELSNSTGNYSDSNFDYSKYTQRSYWSGPQKNRLFLVNAHESLPNTGVAFMEVLVSYDIILLRLSTYGKSQGDYPKMWISSITSSNYWSGWRSC